MVHGDVDEAVAGRGHRQVHQARHSPARGPDLVALDDATVGACCRIGFTDSAVPTSAVGGIDPAAPAQELQGVHIEVDAGAGGGVERRLPDLPAVAPPSAATAAAAIAGKPTPMPMSRLSTTVTRSVATSAAASTAASYVPERSAERWTETTACAPSASSRR